MFYQLLIKSLLCGVGVASVSGPLGCFLVWRKMAYFGDTLAHSALLGVALGLMFSINTNIAVMVCCLAIAFLLVLLQNQRNLATDTLLGTLAHSSLALGMIVVAMLGSINVDIMSYLFGDILTVTSNDLIIIYSMGTVVLGLLMYFWRPLLAMTVDEDIAFVEGNNILLLRLLLMLLIAVVISMAMKVVGILLITSLLIIPAASSRAIAKTPESMAFFAALIGCLSVVVGLVLSLFFDLPSGPAIVFSEALFFALLNLGLYVHTQITLN